MKSALNFVLVAFEYTTGFTIVNRRLVRWDRKTKEKHARVR